MSVSLAQWASKMGRTRPCMKPAKKAKVVRLEGGSPPTCLRGLVADWTYVVGSETSLPMWKPVWMSALQRALMVFSKSPLVSAGACGSVEFIVCEMTKIPFVGYEQKNKQ